MGRLTCEAKGLHEKLNDRSVERFALCFSRALQGLGKTGRYVSDRYLFHFGTMHTVRQIMGSLLRILCRHLSGVNHKFRPLAHLPWMWAVAFVRLWLYKRVSKDYI